MEHKFPVDDGGGQWPVAVGRGKLAPGFSGAHDVGGVEQLLKSPIDLTEKPLQLWERQTHAIAVLLSGLGLLTAAELRRGIEHLHPEHYRAWSYYEKWAVSICQILLESKLISAADLNEDTESAGAICSTPRFKVGDRVQVKEENILSRWRKPHLRTPGYIFGAVGVVERYCGWFGDPSFDAFQRLGLESETQVDVKQHLYRVRFQQKEVWEGYDSTHDDTIDVEIYESWLQENAPGEKTVPDDGHSTIDMKKSSHGHEHSHGDDQEDHVHLDRIETEQKAVDSEGEETPGVRVAKGLCHALVKNNVLTLPQINNAIEKVDTLGSKGEGSRIVARAWVDEEFKEKLLRDATGACADLGITATNSTTPTVLTVVENTANVHNLIVCTLCSCYPLSILGLSPPWYKSREYRAQAVRKPREMLKCAFGLEVPSDVAIRVHDSTADLRYMVLPQRPKGTEQWSETELQRLITRDCLIGVSVPQLGVMKEAV